VLFDNDVITLRDGTDKLPVISLFPSASSHICASTSYFQPLAF